MDEWLPSKAANPLRPNPIGSGHPVGKRFGRLRLFERFSTCGDPADFPRPNAIRRKAPSVPVQSASGVATDRPSLALRAVDNAVGRIGQLSCWEHFNPLGALRLDGRWRADSLGDVSRFVCRRPFFPSRCRSASANTLWNPAASSSMPPPGWTPTSRPKSCKTLDVLSVRSQAGVFTAIVSPKGELMGEPLRSGEGTVIADLDFF